MVTHDDSLTDEGTAEKNELKISCNKILKINDENLKDKNEEIQVLHVECESLKEASTKIANFSFENYSNVFVVAIKLSKPDESSSEKLENLMLQKLSDDRPIIIEICSKKTTKFYVKHRGTNEFSSIKLSDKHKLLEKKIKQNGLTIDALLLILDNSLLEADYSNVNSHFKNTNVETIKLAVDAGDELCIRLIKLFIADEFSHEIQHLTLFSAIKTRNFGLFLAAMNAFDETQITNDKIKELLSLKFDSNCVFMTAIESKNEKLVIFLLKFVKEFQNFFTFKLFEESLNAIKNREFFEIFDDFKNSKFRASNKEKKLMKYLIDDSEAILSEISTLLSSIKSKKLMELEALKVVMNFAKKNPNYRLCYGRSKVCALDLSIDHKCFKIYSFLRSKGFYTDKSENLSLKIHTLTNEEKESIRIENLKHVVCNPEAFIGKILSKCSFDSQSPIASSDVREMLLKFKEINEINSMFPTIAHANFNTIFDYKNKSVHTMDPNGDEFTLGQAYFKDGILYVGKNVSKNQHYGTFAHEMTHFMYFLIFENDCLPYCKGDTVREAEWNDVVKKVKRQYENNPETTDNIIKWVFMCYDPGYQQSAETAVRVNDMLAFYHDNPMKIVELEGLHAELFNYMREKVLPDLKIPNVYRMIQLNNELGLIKKIKGSKVQVEPTENAELLNHIAKHGNKVVVFSSNVPTLTLSKIFSEIESLPGNKLHVKAKNLFIDVEKLNQKNINDELYALLKEDDTILRLILHGDFNKKEDFESLNTLVVVLNTVYRDIEYYIVVDRTCEEKFMSKFNTKQINHTWSDLTQESQKFILDKKVNFRGSKTFKVSNFFKNSSQSISVDILPLLCTEGEISVKCDSNAQTKFNFIQRTVLRKFIVSKDEENVNSFDFEEFPLESFIKKTKDERVVIISDVAGSGKTTLLKIIKEILLCEHEAFWISFVNLRSFVEEFKKGPCDSFVKDIIKILKLDVLHSKIFTEMFNNGEVKILFDGFDEISPNCKKEVLKVFKRFFHSEPNNKNQIFITTRTHLEDDLESALHALGSKIQALGDHDQVKFVIECWEKDASSLGSELIQEGAKLMVSKIAEMISTNRSLIGLPLIIQGLAKVYKRIICQNIETFKKEIDNLRILDVYKKIIDLNLDELAKKHQEKVNDILKKADAFMKVFQFHAIAHLFDEKLARNLGLSYKSSEWSFEEIMRGGIGNFFENNKFEFNHQTYAEYLAALVAFGILEHKNNPCEEELNFLMKILTEEKFQITRMFLNEMLENFKPEAFQILSSGKFCDFIQTVENGEKVLCLSAFEGMFYLFTFFLKLIKNFNGELYVKVLLAQHQNYTNFVEITSKVNDRENIKNLMEELYSDYAISQQLLERDKESFVPSSKRQKLIKNDSINSNSVHEVEHSSI